MTRGKETHPRVKELVRMEYATNANLAETSRIFGLGIATVKRIVEEEPDKLEEYRNQKIQEMIDDAADWKKDFLKRAEEGISKAINLSTQRIELATVAHEKFDERLEKLVEALQDNRADQLLIGDIVKQMASIMNVPLKDLSTYIGTLYDKRALANGEPTSRSDNTNKVKGELEITAKKLEDYF